MSIPVVSKNEVLKQFHRLQTTGFKDPLATAAAANGLPAPYVFAIASRETNCTNELGDKRGGEAHGVGIMQIDIQHKIARDARDDGSWQTKPQPLIDLISSRTSSIVMFCAENTAATSGAAASSPMSRCCVPAYWARHSRCTSSIA